MKVLDLINMLPDSSKYIIDSIKVQKNLAKSINKNSEILTSLIAKGKSIINTYDKLAIDIILILYLNNPKLLPIEKINEGYKLNYEIIKNIMQSNHFVILSSKTINDKLATSIGAIKLHEIILEELDKMQNDTKNNGQQTIKSINKFTGAEDSIEEQIEKYSDLLMDQEIDPNDTISSDILINLEIAQKIADEMRDELLKKYAKENINNISNSVSAKLTSVDNEVSTNMEEIKLWGFTPGKQTKIPIDSILKAIKYLEKHPSLKSYADSIGKMRDIVNVIDKEKSQFGLSAIDNITTGDNINKMLTSNKMLLTDDILDDIFMQRYISNNLLQYENTHNETKGRGPIIFLLDNSGSMGPWQTKWGKSIAVCLLEIAQKQYRNYAFINFSCSINNEIIIEKGTLNPQNILDICQNDYGGGTDFQTPLNRALDIIEKDEFKKADIIIATDGHANVQTNFRKRFNNLKEIKQFNLYGIMIGDATSTTLKLICDQISLLQSQNVNDVSADIFKKIL